MQSWHSAGPTLFDAEGARLSAERHWQDQGLAGSVSLPAYIRFCCRNYGYVALEATADTTRITFHSGQVRDEATIALFYYLVEVGSPARFFLLDLGRKIPPSIVPNFAQLLQTLKTRETSRAPDDYIFRSVSPGHITGSLKEIVERWKLGLLDLREPEALKTQVGHLCDQYMVIRVKSGDLLFEGVGQGKYAVLGGHGLKVHQGRSLHTMKNNSHVKRASARYVRAVNGNEPVLDEVDALACLYDVSTLRRLRYRRLLLEQRLANDDSLLLSLSIDDPLINLRRTAC